MEFSDDELERDPVLGRLVKDLKHTKAQLGEALEGVKTLNERTKRHEDTFIASGYQQQLANIAAHHERRFRQRFDRDAFLGFAVQRGVSDLGVAYRAWALDSEIEKARKEAEERGAEQGRREAGSGRSLWDAPRIRPPHLGGVESLDQLTDDQVFADPDIRKALSGEDEE